MKNFSLKLWSLFIAIALAMFVHSQSRSTVRTIVVPIEHKGGPEDLVILLPTERKVQVTVRGPVHLVTDLIQSPPVVTITFDETVERTFRKVFQASDFSLPFGVELLEVEPNDLEYVTDSMISKDLPVVAPTFGTLPEGVRLRGVNVIPSTVSVRGPESLFADTGEVRTEPIDLRGVRKAGSIQARLRGLGDFFQIDPDVVEVRLDASSIEVERSFPGLPIEVRSSPGKNFLVTPERVTVKIAGIPKVVEQITASDLTPFVRARRISQEGRQIAVQLETPESYRFVDAEPTTVLIKPLREVLNGISFEGSDGEEGTNPAGQTKSDEVE